MTRAPRTVVDPAPDREDLQPILAKVAAEWRLTIDAIPDVILVCDPHRIIHRLNRSALSLLGGTYADWVGEPIAAIESHRTLGAIIQCARTFSIEPSHATQRIRDGHTGEVWDVTCTGWASLPDTVVVVARNVTDTVQLQESLTRAEGMAEMGRLLAAVAHEVRNPLFGISALLEAWNINLAAADAQSYMALLTREVSRLRTLMADLLEYGKPFTVDLQVASLRGTVLEAIRTCEHSAAAAGVAVSSTINESLVRMDASRLPRVFINLLENAIQHSTRGSEVHVSIERDALNRATVHITDAGPGFSDEMLRHAFTPFHSRRQGGTGLGLAIVKRIVDEHGGNVSVRNNAVNGATVTVTLPPADYPA